ncbi:phenylacetaldehyde reductase-like [Hibiscus syriacus]|nr:phenylacetaldehyde reductase-like [Hibiscus syriacus]
MSEAEKVVCVTGASGFIGSWLVRFLLDRGYSVNATVRDPNDPEKTQHLLALVGANERLHLFKAELLEEGSFDSPVEGCVGVFHTASPCFIPSTVKDPQAEMVEPAVKGTLNVLRACAKVPSIKRVIVTSSLAAVVLTGKPLADDVVVNETWFSDPILCQKSKQWYMLSKTVAEKAAWEFSKENGIDMVSINPGMVSGPPLQPTVNVSLLPIVKLIGAETFSDATFRWVDVRDVADVHIHAFESSSARGRYLVTGKPMHSSEVLKILRELYPDLSFPERMSDKKGFISAFPAFQVSLEKVKSLGVEFTPLEVSLKDTIDGLREKKLLAV